LERQKSTLTQIDDLKIENKIRSLTKYIGQVILLNAGHNKDLGLFSGKMGSAIYLYNLDKGKETCYFHNFANELISNINDKIGFINSFYTSGSTGIAWGIKYLCKNDFIENNEVETLLNNFDDFCLTTSDYQLNIDFYGICSYLLGRLNEEKDSNKNDLRYLLKQERIISQIDYLTNSIFSRSYLQNDILEYIINHKSHPYYLRIEIDNICNSVTVLSKAKKQNIYLEIVNRAMKILDQKIVNYLTSLSDYMIRITGDNNALTYFNLICGLHYAHLILARDLELENKFDFSGFLSLISNKVLYAPSRDFNSHEEVIVNSILFRLNEIEKNRYLKSFVDQRMSALVEDLYNNRRLEEIIYSNKYPLNLGLTGIAGLGMVLLQRIIPEIADWDESLLIS
jgi:hypothetical protein